MRLQTCSDWKPVPDCSLQQAALLDMPSAKSRQMALLVVISAFIFSVKNNLSKENSFMNKNYTFR